MSGSDSLNLLPQLWFWALKIDYTCFTHAIVYHWGWPIWLSTHGPILGRPPKSASPTVVAKHQSWPSGHWTSDPHGIWLGAWRITLELNLVPHLSWFACRLAWPALYTSRSQPVGWAPSSTYSSTLLGYSLSRSLAAWQIFTEVPQLFGCYKRQILVHPIGCQQNGWIPT